MLIYWEKNISSYGLFCRSFFQSVCYLVKQILLAAFPTALVMEPRFVQVGGSAVPQGVGLTNLCLSTHPHSSSWWPFQGQAGQCDVSLYVLGVAWKRLFLLYKNLWGKKRILPLLCFMARMWSLELPWASHTHVILLTHWGGQVASEKVIFIHEGIT